MNAALPKPISIGTRFLPGTGLLLTLDSDTGNGPISATVSFGSTTSVSVASLSWESSKGNSAA